MVTAVFEGELSTELTEANVHKMKRSGFSGIRTDKDMPPLDLEAFDTLAFRLRGDGRSYISNVGPSFESTGECWSLGF
jgi:NADH dehydrogenase [ubiquinone] 1 alpha subcomplex assembly factor 1